MHQPFINNWASLIRYISIFLPLAVVYSALGYFMRHLFCDISKIVLENNLYGKDKERMPTTELLLWTNKSLGEAYKQRIRDKIDEDFEIRLLSKKAEKADVDKARREISGAIDPIRQCCREDNILLQYNIRYGFWRNLFGGNLIALFIVVGIVLLNKIMLSYIPLYDIIAFVLIILIMLLSVVFMNMAGRGYAHQLFSVYLNTRVKNV